MRKFIVSVLIASLLIGLMASVSFAETSEFSDIDKSYAKDAILELQAKGIINGMDNSHFNPKGTLTRAEFVTIMVRSLGLDISATTSSFSDVSGWAIPYVEAAYKAGIISGTGGGKFSPGTATTREMSIVILVRSLQTKGELDENATLNFTDANKISDWAKPFIAIAQKYGLVTGNPDGSFNPKGKANREMAAIMGSNLLVAIVIVVNVEPKPDPTPEPDPTPTPIPTPTPTPDPTPPYNGGGGYTPTPDTTPPTAPTVDITEGALYDANGVTPTISIAPADANQTVTLDNSAYTNVAITTDGAHVLVITNTDSTGNASSITVNFTVDAVVPNAPLVTNTGYINFTNQATYAITGTGEVGDTVNVTVTDGVSVTAAVYGTVDATNNFSMPVDISTLAEGSVTIIATQTDTAGNVSLASTPVSVTKDTTAPVISNASLLVSTTYGLALNFKINEEIDLGTSGNIAISYFTKNGGVLTPISNTLDGNSPLVKDKTWGGYLWSGTEASPVKYSKGSDSPALSNVVPANIALSTLVKNGFAADNTMNYTAITDWTAPATYVVKIQITDNAGNASVMIEVEVTIPAAPVVTADDAGNLIVGADAAMEYSTDAGATWTLYDVATPPTFLGNVTVEVRVAADIITGAPAGAITTLTFTTP